MSELVKEKITIGAMMTLCGVVAPMIASYITSTSIVQAKMVSLEQKVDYNALQREEIQNDIKRILSDVGYIKGALGRNK